MTKANDKTEIKNDNLSTEFYDKIEGFHDFDECFLKPIDKIENVENVIFCIEYIFFIYQFSYKNKLEIRDKNFYILGDIELNTNGNSYYISEIKEDENYYIIINQGNKLYKVEDFKNLKLICDLEIELILQIKNKEYIISNNNGIFKYNGSLLNITREKLENKNNKTNLKNLKYNFGIAINEGKIILANKDNLLASNEIISNYKNFSKNCYESLKVNIPDVLNNNKSKKNICIFGCKKDEKYGFLIVDFQYIDGKFIETDNFEISCIFKIPKNRSSMINAFSEEFDIKYNYFLISGYQHYDNNKECKIKLYRFNQDNYEMEKIKDIRIENNTIFDIHNCNLNLKSIIQYNKNTLLINCDNEIIKLNIMNLESEIEEEIIENGNDSFHKEISNYCDKKNGYYSCYLEDIKNIPNIFNDNLIKNIHQLENGNYIIIQEKNFLIASFEDSSFSLKYNDRNNGAITNICEINRDKVIFQQKNELYKLEFSKIKDNDYGIRKDPIYDKKYNLLLNITKRDKKNDYIVSLKEGTFEFEDIPFIKNKDIKTQNKIALKTYNFGKIIEINNNKFVVLIDDISFEIININNKEKINIKLKRNWKCNQLDSCFTSFKVKEDSNIFICAIKNIQENKNGFIVINTELPFKIQEKLVDTNKFEIKCMCPFKKNIEEDKFCSYFLIGGIIDNFKVEVRLYKIDGLDKNNLSIEYIKTVFYSEEGMNSITSINQSNINGEVIISSKDYIYKLFILIEEKEEKKGALK